MGHSASMERMVPRQLRESCQCVHVIATYSIPLLCVWAGLFYLGATQGLEFLSATSTDLYPDDHTQPGWVAARAVGEYFVQKSAQYPFSHAVVVSLKEPSRPDATVDSAAVANLTAMVLSSTLFSCDTLPTARKKRYGAACWWRRAHGLFVEPTPADFDRADFISPDNRSATLIVLETNRGFGDVGTAQLVAWRRLQATLDDWKADHDEYVVGSTHEQMLLNAAQHGVVRDFEHGDMMTLPIAFAILLYACGPSAFVALLTLPTTLLSTFYVLEQIASGTWLCSEGHAHGGQCPGTPRVSFASFTPALFVNALLALSFDYTLFFLARYREECERHTSSVSALARTLTHAGRVIAASGGTLGLCFTGLTFSDDKIIPALGWGGAVSCTIAVLVHLTLLPALLFFCPACVARPRVPRKRVRSGWVRLALCCRTHRRKVVAGILLLTAPWAYLATQLRLTSDQGQLVPRHAPSLEAMRSITRHGMAAGILDPVLVVVYNRGTRRVADGRSEAPVPSLGCQDDNLDLWNFVHMLPGLEHDHSKIDRWIILNAGCKFLDFGYHICNASRAPMIRSKDDAGHICYEPITPYIERLCPGTCHAYCDAAHDTNDSIFNDDLFDHIHRFRSALEQSIPLPRSAIRDITTLPSNRSVVLSAADALVQLGYNDSAYQSQARRLINYNYSAAFIEIVLPAGQSGKGGFRLLNHIRQLAASPPFSTSPYGFLVYGDAANVLDTINAALAEAPKALAVVSFVVIFVVAGAAFASLLVPLRLLLTILVTLVWVAGASTLVWQRIYDLDGLYWCVPLSCGCLVVGLTLDYDIFLVGRVFEYRRIGYCTEAAIIRAMDRQSHTITTAGVIMAVAFSSLLFSSTVVLNEFGWSLVVATLVDTFVVRTVLVPSLMFCAVEWNWWPGKMPPAELLEYDDEPTVTDLLPLEASAHMSLQLRPGGPDALALAAARTGAGTGTGAGEEEEGAFVSVD